MVAVGRIVGGLVITADHLGTFYAPKAPPTGVLAYHIDLKSGRRDRESNLRHS